MVGAYSWKWEFRRMVSTSNISETYGRTASAVGFGYIRPLRTTTANSTVAFGSRRYFLRAFLCLTVGSISFFGCFRPARAQTQFQPSGSASVANIATADAMPSPTLPSSDFAHFTDGALAENSAADTEFLPGVIPADAWVGDGRELLGMFRESMFGSQKDAWKATPLNTLFSDGWLEPWHSYPRSTTGALRQPFINAYDGVFYRLCFFDFTYVNNSLQNGNAYLGSFSIFTPISQRFQLYFSLPFIQSGKGGLSNTYHGNVGDFIVSPRFLLSDTQDFSQVVECFVRTPTGNTVNGNGQSTLAPQYEFWYGGLPGAGVIRGGAGLTIPTNSAGVTSNVTGDPITIPGSRTTANYNLAIGKYWTQHDATLGDLATYVSINGYTTVDDRGPRYSYLSITPGLRFHLANNYYFIAGVEVPLTGPRDQSFTYSPIFWLAKVW
jgi:hypothetical protein